LLTNDDLIDVIMEALQQQGLRTVAPAKAGNTASKGRLFLSEYDIRRRLTGDARELRIPKGAIISPLALDWLSLKAIRIVEE